MTGNKKIFLISSSGGHYEQLRMLSSLEKHFETVWITELTEYSAKADYFLIQTGSKDKNYILKMLKNFIKSVHIWHKEKPDIVITTGAMVAIPMAIIAKIFRKKIIFIETFARVNDGTKTGKLMYKFADLFIYQWESLKEIYPKGKFGGSIY